MRHQITLACMAWFISGSVLAQAPSAEVRKFLQYDQPLIALTHVRVIDGTGAPAQEDRTVLLRDGRIDAITDARTAPPKGAQVIDLTGRSVIPGLVGMHNHLMYTASINRDDEGRTPPPGMFVTEIAFSAPRLYLAAGVTTMRTTGSVEPYTDLNIRRQIDAFKIPGPHLDVTGPYLEGKDTFFPQMAVLTETEHARKTVDFWAGEGVTSFKAYVKISQPVLAAAVDQAHKHGLKVTGHLCAVDYRQAAALGIDNLEHGPVFTDSEFVAGRAADECPASSAVAASWEQREIGSPEVQALIADLVAHNVAITSTLPVFEAFVPTRPLLSRQQMALMSPESLRSHLEARALASTTPGYAARQEALLKKEMAFELAFVRAGGLLLAGPDPTGNGGTLPGFGDQRGVQLLVEAGFTPLEAIRIATLNGARYMGRQDSIGSIAPGKHADLVVLKGDPTRRIADIENVEIVFKDGYGYDPARLNASVRGMVGIR
ncbi:amidohydrolase family protein [Duganella sp. CY15W]|uniref:amidohydrolase family protein n=1 Tax=Duganella sp. CY15W TaxID=2692172 RepID=UPI00136C6052|nr:amidohydrolase family protein [Duganella sp. CY15W]MYM28608.1 amidohydrolase family protein [Duganella sp. CY15W]